MGLARGAVTQGFVSRGERGDQVDDRLACRQAQLQEHAELGTADAGVRTRASKLRLLARQPGLIGVVVSEEEPGGTPKVRAIASISFICGLAVCPFRSFQIVVYETRSPVVRSIRSATSALLQGSRPAGRALSMSQFTLSARERRVGSASVLSVVSSDIATPASANVP